KPERNDWAELGFALQRFSNPPPSGSRHFARNRSEGERPGAGEAHQRDRKRLGVVAGLRDEFCQVDAGQNTRLEGALLDALSVLSHVVADSGLPPQIVERRSRVLGATNRRDSE